MGITEYLEWASAIFAGLFAAAGGVVIALGANVQRLRLARGLFLAAGLPACVGPMIFGVTYEGSMLWRITLTAGTGEVLGALMYILVTWLNHEIRLRRRHEPEPHNASPRVA